MPNTIPETVVDKFKRSHLWTCGLELKAAEMCAATNQGVAIVRQRLEELVDAGKVSKRDRSGTRYYRVRRFNMISNDWRINHEIYEDINAEKAQMQGM